MEFGPFSDNEILMVKQKLDHIKVPYEVFFDLKYQDLQNGQNKTASFLIIPDENLSRVPKEVIQSSLEIMNRSVDPSMNLYYCFHCGFSSQKRDLCPIHQKPLLTRDEIQRKLKHRFVFVRLLLLAFAILFFILFLIL